MLTQDQLNSIGGQSTYRFITTIGNGIEKVDVLLSFEYDHEGIYNTCIESVTFQGIDVSGCLTEDTLNSLEMEGVAKHEATKGEYCA
jgi:hypothetical protein